MQNNPKLKKMWFDMKYIYIYDYSDRILFARLCMQYNKQYIYNKTSSIVLVFPFMNRAIESF
jgi:hypothetical protein